MTSPRRRKVYSYFFAAFLIAAATEIRYLLDPLLGEHLVFSMYYLAVSLAGWAGGFTPAVGTALGSCWLANYLFSRPRGVLRIDTVQDFYSLVLFVVVSIVIGIISEISLRSQARAREAEQQKDDFLAILAHELRNPLAIIHYTNLAEDASRSAGQPGRSEIIDRQVQQLDQMIDDLLDISQVSRGKFRLHCERIYVSTLIDDAIDKSQSFVEGRGHELTVERPAEEMTLWGDSVRLQQVIMNLLSNAARYTPRGGRIEFRATQENGLAVFRVRDNGLGIAKDMLSRIFDLQTQVSRSLETSGPSLGVGLALVRTLVELHGGTVTALSEGPNKGSEFIVRLPLYRPQPEPVPQVEKPS
jgi:signal transduction histidine kinase